MAKFSLHKSCKVLGSILENSMGKERYKMAHYIFFLKHRPSSSCAAQQFHWMEAFI